MEKPPRSNWGRKSGRETNTGPPQGLGVLAAEGGGLWEGSRGRGVHRVEPGEREGSQKNSADRSRSSHRSKKGSRQELTRVVITPPVDVSESMMERIWELGKAGHGSSKR